MIYREKTREPNIELINDDFRNHINRLKERQNVVVVTDPPFNIGYHYSEYKDKMKDNEYFEMLSNLVKTFPSVIIHYPEMLHRLSIETGVAPSRVVSWVYNSNTARQHRDIAFYGVTPDFTRLTQEYKNPTDKRIIERINRGIRGGERMIFGMLIKLKMFPKTKQVTLAKCL